MAWRVAILKLPANLLLATTGNSWQLAAQCSRGRDWVDDWVVSQVVWAAPLDMPAVTVPVQTESDRLAFTELLGTRHREAELRACRCRRVANDVSYNAGGRIDGVGPVMVCR